MNFAQPRFNRERIGVSLRRNKHHQPRNKQRKNCTGSKFHRELLPRNTITDSTTRDSSTWYFVAASFTLGQSLQPADRPWFRGGGSDGPFRLPPPPRPDACACCSWN